MPHTLRLTPDFSDYLIFGLSTHLKDYKLCWSMNDLLQIQLVRYEDLPVQQGDELRAYSLFVQKEVFEHIDIYLISNYFKHIPWFATAKHFHYFFIIRGNPLESQIDFFETNLKKIPQMLLVSKLSSHERKLALPLLTDLELHLTQTAQKEKEALKYAIPKRAGIKHIKKKTDNDSKRS